MGSSHAPAVRMEVARARSRNSRDGSRRGGRIAQPLRSLEWLKKRVTTLLLRMKPLGDLQLSPASNSQRLEPIWWRILSGFFTRDWQGEPGFPMRISHGREKVTRTPQKLWQGNQWLSGIVKTAASKRT